jgi:hypothetical protein
VRALGEPQYKAPDALTGVVYLAYADSHRLLTFRFGPPDEKLIGNTTIPSNQGASDMTNWIRKGNTEEAARGVLCRALGRARLLQGRQTEAPQMRDVGPMPYEPDSGARARTRGSYRRHLRLEVRSAGD